MTSKSNYNFLACFYDTKEMRETFPKSYEYPFLTESMLIPGKIICSNDLLLFGTTVVKVLKNSTFAERNADIRRQMEIDNIYVPITNISFKKNTQK